MSPGMRELIRYLAYVAVQEYIEEVRIEKAKAQKEICDRQPEKSVSQRNSRGEK